MSNKSIKQSIDRLFIALTNQTLTQSINSSSPANEQNDLHLLIRNSTKGYLFNKTPFKRKLLLQLTLLHLLI